MIDRDDVHWYRDAIIYQLHVKSFFDSDSDGVGDFEGLTQKLDYVKDLGATAIWLMPFYPSPLRDDGYDISNYRGIHPAYGDLRDFKHFVREAHARGLRVITELVINHTSDAHPWFKRARAAKPGSAARKFYVWSDSDQGYKDAPINFLDTEKSNWTWDEQAQAYYWHRFYFHQPDLNFDNPRVVEAVLDVMRYWLDMGVDGLRLDAVPYLIEREGTSCENLPETHAIVKKIRAAVDADYPDRMLLAEANLWPEETAQYFGNGDECHMAFHFPLMPRIYMALAQEDRHPISDIMRQTPEIPDTAQWAIFLRNHDEMTLAMVADKERDYLWSFYAADRRARLNLGIRRRLAPLLENDRRKIELLTSLLLSMPGAPVLYYGDEIGMGDNIYLGDRDGVRTPMQWSVDRNGGFSRADPAKLVLPTIQDPIYGFSAVNVEAQLASPASLLTWMRRLIAVRRAHLAFGRGSLRFLYPSNRKVLVYLREMDGERILCVVNVSRAPQAVELDLSEFKGAIPVELTAGSLFPHIGTAPYLLTLPAYGFFWFRLEKIEAENHQPDLQTAPELFTLVATGKLETILSGRELVAFERNVAPRFLASRRWFIGQGRFIQNVTVRDFAVLRDGEQGRFILPVLDVRLVGGETEVCFTPFSAEEERDEQPDLADTVAKLRRAARLGLLYEAESCPRFGAAMLRAFQCGQTLAAVNGGRFVFTPTPALDADLMIDSCDVRRIRPEEGEASVALANRLTLKTCSQLQSGLHPEVEILRFLNDVAHFDNAPLLLGAVDYIGPDEASATLATLQTFVRGQGDAWTWTLEASKRILETASLSPGRNDQSVPEGYSTFTPYVRRLGLRTAQMHKALSTPTNDSAFQAEDLTYLDVAATACEAKDLAEQAFARLHCFDHSSEARSAADRLAERRKECFGMIDSLAKEPLGASKIRIHGDYHLKRAIVVKDDVIIVGFGGNPRHSFEKRRAKRSPLRDVACMLRSFAYVAAAAKRDIAKFVPDPSLAADRLRERLVEFSHIFTESYMAEARDSAVWIEDQSTRRRLLMLYLLLEAFRELGREADSRPDWIDVPLEGVNAVLDRIALIQ